MHSTLPVEANTIIQHFALRRRVLVIFVHDLFVAMASFPLAWVLREGWGVLFRQGLLQSTLAFSIIAAGVFVALGLYRGVWRHSSAWDLIIVLRAATLAILIFLPVMFISDRLATVPRTVPIIQWLLLLIMLGGPRFAFRIWGGRMSSRPRNLMSRVPVIIAGTGESADLLIRAVTSDPQERYQVLGLLDLHTMTRGRDILRVPILGSIEELASVVHELAVKGRRPERLIFAEQVDGSLLRRVMGQAEGLRLELLRLPDPIDFKATVDDGRIELRPFALQELLGRPQIQFDHSSVRDLIKGRRILVTGAGGSIGSELMRQLARCEPSMLVYLDQCEFNLYSVEQELVTKAPSIVGVPILADIRDGKRIKRIFAEHCPDLIFHAAALKHVPMVEMNPIEGLHTNALGTRNVAEAAAECGARAMIQISTDKAVNPTSVMGASKRLAELYCQALDAGSAELQPVDRRTKRTRFMTVRFGNVLGSSGSVVPLFQKQISQGGPLTVTHPEIKRYFMTIREAVELVLQASSVGIRPDCARGQVFVLDMGEPIRIVDLARQIIRLAGKEPERDVQIVFSGLRPGEKLHEELFDRGEVRLPAIASGVLAARTQRVDDLALRKAFHAIDEACARGDAVWLRAILQFYVPGYVPDDQVAMEAKVADVRDIQAQVQTA
ncbi:polysaccharide biosynthesis protein [Geminicoccus roseus]|uniref:polysaccharide biosynthesis protein n=1 Tax=Geminicoccus roseus TaxID=404900 RepID=UPI00040F0427|nr:nucleoside-diphosphate sugar epimerase/dehydratase [Geminicoccus roseus]